MQSVFLLFHQYDLDDDDTSKLLGVYSSHDRAERRMHEARSLPGFRRFPDAFIIDEYVIDENRWTSGFEQTDADGISLDD